MSDDPNLAFWVIIWAIVIVIVVADRWRKGVVGAGLPAVFLLNLWLIHWPAAVIYLLPWYLDYTDPYNDSLVKIGFQQSAYAVMSFAVGGVFLAPLFMRVFRSPRPATAAHTPDTRLPKIYMAIGVLCVFVLFSPIGRIGTLNALIASGVNFLLVAFCLSCWGAWQEKRRAAFIGWLVASLICPSFTIVALGFLGFGVMFLFSLFAFVASFVRPRWKLVVGTLLVAYIGISFYGSYMLDRAIIRELVWDEQAPLIDRVEQLYKTVKNVEWFNPFNPVHLYLIDARLNMNSQVGAGVNYLASGNAEYAEGATLWWSVVGMIPRAVWPGKPAIAGGSDLVSRYTGMEFSEETSVGITLIMEFYVNYGAAAVILGFLCLGLILTTIDSAAGQRLSKGDWKGFTFRFLPGLALVNPGNSLVEVTTSVGASVVMAYLVNNYLLSHLRGKRVLPGQKGVKDHSDLQTIFPIGGSK